MDALGSPFDPDRPAHGPIFPFPLWVLVPFAAVGLAGVAAVNVGGASPALGGVLGGTGFHGGLLAACLAAAWQGSPGWQLPASLLALSLLVAGAGCALAPLGCLAYLLPPIVAAGVAYCQSACRRAGLAPPRGWRAVWVGAAVGGFLGGHLLVSASRSFAYPMRSPLAAPYLSAVLYDLGANALSAECFFRGTLFNYWQRRWGFWPAALSVTGLSLLRYLVDPALPWTSELLAGAIFYLALLSLSGCALVWYSGSLVPSLEAALIFFASYRLLDVR